MGDTGPIESLLDGIYDAAVDGNRWPAVLRQLAGHFGSGSAHLTVDVASNAGHGVAQPRMISFGTDPAFSRSYAEYYATRNVFWDRLVARALTGVMTNRMLMSKDEALRSEFYNDYLRPQEGEEILGALASRHGRIGTSFTFWRPERYGPWQTSDMKQLAALAPHLTRALRIGDHFGTTETLNSFSAEALYRLGRGLFIVTCSAMVLFANEVAESQLAERGLKLRQQRLAAEQPAQSEALHQLILSAAERKRGGSMIVTRGEAAPLLLMVIPVRTDSWNAVGGQPAAMVVTKDLNPAAPRPLDAFSSHYGLTPAETRVAGELLVGDGIAGVARRLHVSEATARTHRNRVFQKTGVRRQAELVRLIVEWSEGTPGSVPM